MELMELYNYVQNPIDNPQVIEKLINAYANSSKGFGGFYGQLTKTVEKVHNKGQYYVEDTDRFYSMMFNKWKNSIVAMTKDEFIELYKRGSYRQDFIKMRNYLRNVPDVSTMKEANDIFFSSKNDKELEDALEKCDEHHLPYYFKFDQYANRDDTIVIYSSTANLTKYVEILQEIKREHPELVSRAKEPPVLTGQIDGWIGYGSEPSKTPDGKNHSFNEVRSNAIEPAIAQTTKKWIMDHRSMQITYQDQKVNFQDYIAMKSTESLIADLERRFTYYEENDKKAAQLFSK